MTYKPSEHGGLKEDGTPDKRTNPEHGFGGDTERASKLGAEGGKTQPDEVYKPSGTAQGVLQICDMRNVLAVSDQLIAAI